jgi:pentatricopeptide repeat protein
MLADTWKLLEEIISKNMLDTQILNNVMHVYANALQEDKIDGLILPLFDKFNLQMDSYSYEVLMDLHYKKKDFNTAIRVWQQMKVQLEENKQKFIEQKGAYRTEMEMTR